MRRLAIEGGKPIVREPIKPLQTIGQEEAEAVSNFMRYVADGRATLSGYLAGSDRGGSAVQRLETIWASEFNCTYAVACNSGTSAILAACMAVGVKGRRVLVPALCMSAATAVPMILGANVEIVDVDEHYCINPPEIRKDDVVIAVNLFGHPAKLFELRAKCDAVGAWLIEDNAQAPWAKESNVYTGTIGHIGCWSFNVHKATNSGEGGMCTTSSDVLAYNIRGAINHGEMSLGILGLNLRMPEIVAVNAITQMNRAKEIIKSRRELATNLQKITMNVSKEAREDCLSSWYCYPMLMAPPSSRDWIVKALNAEGVPVRAGYTYLPSIPAFSRLKADCVSSSFFESRMLLLELCSIDPTPEQVEQIGEAIREIGGML